MVIVFNLVIFLNRDLFISPELYGFSFGTLALLIVGFWDDIKEIFWKMQLFVQVAISVIVFIMGVRIYYISNPISGGIINLDSGLGMVISLTFVILWIVIVINAVNWADGIDGMAGGITFITALAILILSFRPEVNQPPIAIICSIFLGAVLGFLFFNFYPSKIMAGTSGAMFMGYSLAVLAIFAGTKIATALTVLSVPIIDLLWVIGERIKNKKSIFSPDKNHLHYKLIDLGWSQKKVMLVYCGFILIIAFISLNTRSIGKSITILVVAMVMVSVLILINKKIAKLKKVK